METCQGDLLSLAKDGTFDVIVHGCNCFHTMGAGIAKAIATEFPEALAADRNTPHGDKSKLGTISVAHVTCEDRPLTIVNADTQFNYRGPGPKADYEAISRCFYALATTLPKSRIGYPMIGAGLAGGDWPEIAPLIDAALDGCKHTLGVLPS